MKLKVTFVILFLALTFSAFGQTPGTLRFPAALDTDVSLGEVQDRAQTVLSATVSSVGLTLTVTSTASFPATGFLTLEDERLYYTAKTATTFTVVRGQFGSTAAAHSSGTAVRQTIIAKHHQILSSAVQAIEAKVGVTSSNAATALSGYVLTADGAGNTTWSSPSGGVGLVDGDKGDITVSASGATWTVDASAITSTKILDGTILNADINASAAIALSKLNITGTPTGAKFLRDDGSWQSIPGGGDALVANPLSQFAATTSAQLAGVLSDETGTGAFVLAASPTLTTPNLGTPSAATLTNATGLPIATGVSGLGTGVATLLATPSSANLASVITDETGTGVAVFSASPTLTGTPLAPTASPGTDTTQIATTAFVTAAVAAGGGGVADGDKGDVTVSASGATWTIDASTITSAKITDGAILNTDVNASAAIAYTKLALTDSIVDADVNSAAAIGYSKMAALTASRAMVTTAGGVASASSITATQLGYLSGATSNLQVQIDAKGDAFVANPLSQFASTTSAQLSGVLSNETGSGAAVFGTSPTIAGGSVTGLTAFGIRSTGAAFDLTLASSEVFTAGRTLSFVLGDAARTLTLGGNATLNGGTHSGTNTGDQTNISGNAATVTTNANLTGVVTSIGNATSIANGAITNAMLANGAVANLSGTNTGDQTTVSGNAGTATALATARTIGGVSFDGTANITVASATGGFAVTTALTTPSTTFALANDTATTVNAFGAATTLNIGASATTILNFGGSTTAAEFRYLEPSGSGTNYSAFKAVAQSANITYSLPATVGAAGTVLTDAAGNGVLSWAAGGGGSPGGSTKQLQFNSAGSFGGAAGFEYQSGASPNVLITAQAASYTALTLNTAASPSADIQKWQVNGTDYLRVNSSGVLGAAFAAQAARDYLSFGSNSVTFFKVSEVVSGNNAKMLLGYSSGNIETANGTGNITFKAGTYADYGLVVDAGLKIPANAYISSPATTDAMVSFIPASITLYANPTNYALQRIGATTIAGNTAGRTVTNAATLKIDGPPVQGSNETITNLYPLWVDAGTSRFDGDVMLGDAGPRWIAGSGSPESVVAAPVGSIYSRTDGGASTSFYVKESGSGTTGWIAK